MTGFCFENDWKNQFPGKESNTNWIIFHKTVCVCVNVVEFDAL